MYSCSYEHRPMHFSSTFLFSCHIVFTWWWFCATVAGSEPSDPTRGSKLAAAGLLPSVGSGMLGWAGLGLW